jgi:exportin-2 (importin alpha re-exporter)
MHLFFMLTIFFPPEFVPYVFQLLSMLLEMRPPGVPDSYMALFPCLLGPALWERPGNVSPLVRLLQAFISRGAEQIASTQKLVGDVKNL